MCGAPAGVVVCMRMEQSLFRSAMTLGTHVVTLRLQSCEDSRYPTQASVAVGETMTFRNAPGRSHEEYPVSERRAISGGPISQARRNACERFSSYPWSRLGLPAFAFARIGT